MRTEHFLSRTIPFPIWIDDDTLAPSSSDPSASLSLESANWRPNSTLTQTFFRVWLVWLLLLLKACAPTPITLLNIKMISVPRQLTLRHLGHLKGFASLWTALCCRKLPEVLKACCRKQMEINYWLVIVMKLLLLIKCLRADAALVAPLPSVDGLVTLQIWRMGESLLSLDEQKSPLFKHNKKRSTTLSNTFE